MPHIERQHFLFVQGPSSESMLWLIGSGSRLRLTAPWFSKCILFGTVGLILHRGNGCDCLHACPLFHDLVPLKCSNIEMSNFLIKCPLPRRKCLGALALSKREHAGLAFASMQTCSSRSLFKPDLWFLNLSWSWRSEKTRWPHYVEGQSKGFFVSQ